MKYDVFISCRKPDYEIAEEICAYLKSKGVKVFFSNRSIDDEGNSLYEKVIANALRDSANMIVLCSNPNFVKSDEDNGEGSRWVYYEWTTFHQMILDKEKPANADIVTIYMPSVDKKELPHRLRNRQCIPYNEYKDRILHYLNNGKTVASQEGLPSVASSNNSGKNNKRKAIKAKRFDWKRLITPLLAGLVGLLLGLGLFFLGKHDSGASSWTKSNSEKTLVLAGGGSVVTFLDAKYRGKIAKDTNVNVFSDNKYPDAIYLHMPSKSALTLLAEEAIMPYSRVNQPFYPVCFSAEQAVDTMFLKKCTKDQMLDAGHIVEYLLGYEKLAVYIDKNIPRLSTVIDSTATEISVNQLIRLLRLGGSTIFSTDKDSGTYHAYYTELLKKTFDLSKVDFKNFSNQSNLQLLQATGPNGEEKPYIILGGDIYKPEGLNVPLEHKEARKLLLVDDVNNHKVLTRPLYIYFLAYREKVEGQDDQFIVPNEVLKLLYKLDFNNSKKLINDKNHLSVLNSKRIIVPIE